MLVTCKSKYVLYSGRLEVKFKGQLADENEIITTAAFNKDSSLVLMGTSAGRIVAYRVADGQPDGNPI